MYVIGLNSGTSFDGIDVALVTFKRNNLIPSFIDGIVYEYPIEIKKRIKDLIIFVGNSRDCSLRQGHEISQLNFLLGELFALAVLKIINKNKLKPKDVLLIGSHGQTIYHHPQVETIGGFKIKSTLQIGESSVIAQRTGIKTVSNFREGDIAASGQGAPLISYLDWITFHKSKDIKAILNIGGIVNITILGNNITPMAFDIGPGNALIDLVSQKDFKKDYDSYGKMAATGKINFELIENALKDDYFKLKPPKTTGKEYFNQDFINKYFSNIKNKHERIATLTFFTAITIEKAFKDFISNKYKVNEIVISGGGIKNRTLMEHLITLLPDIKIVLSDKYNLPYKYKEAILFALLGYTCHLGICNNIPSCTGAKKKVILGKITN